jgi:hypothetical protein
MDIFQYCCHSLNFYKELMLFTLMYILFLVLAWMGFLEWKKKGGCLKTTTLIMHMIIFLS